MATTTINLFQGDDHSIQLTFKDQDSVIINLTGGVVKFVIKKKLEDEDNLAIYLNEDVTKTTPTAGIATDIITDAISKGWDIGKWIWQARFIDSTGLVKSGLVGILNIEEQAFDHE